ncbi:hypothetical protein SELMODRAFT_166238 [Selaginella moellendorffii]|uniref:DUF1995 domain-containing protein n=1 Tax=Selaginella moellendorffii TaxID=88036 RepID=D8QWV2_SELML|nr:protein LOW PSII ACCUMULATION 3, chloroplastic [Selaginella moellendorffii]EFJ35300.1 hypothetical protein SELMODRAFT_166238 [Selaginella moellendorffii]|eukprot:XP_002963429.1 protein LOW PSII ACCUMULATION 3, chloroplastic [Selaginella moellendorffii]
MAMALACRFPSWLVAPRSCSPWNRSGFSSFSLSLHPSIGSDSISRILRLNRNCERWRNRAAVDAASGYDPRDGVAVYKPASYDVLVNDVVDATFFALDEGNNRLEIEFPPLPNEISSYKGSSDDFIDANIQLALAFANKLNAARGIVTKIVFPDNVEKRRASRVFRSAFDLSKGISLGCLDDVPGGNGFLKALRGAFELDFQEDVSGKWQTSSPPSMYVVVNCSGNELPDLQKYMDAVVGSASIVLFNLQLDKLRSDLGLFGFPGKDLQYEFLSQFLPAFYIRTRDYSKNVPFAPFIVNYSGALLRRYPGPWQVMIKQANGVYACVAENRQRFTLGQAKEELLRSLGLQEKEGSNLEFLRRGYKTSTWWEDDAALEKSSAWRS